jgi:hypothetical protein
VAFFDELLGDELGPGAWSVAEVDKSFGVLEDVVLFIDLDQLICASGAVSVGLGLAVVYILKSKSIRFFLTFLEYKKDFSTLLSFVNLPIFDLISYFRQ